MATTEDERELEVVELQKRLTDPADAYTADDHQEGNA